MVKNLGRFLAGMLAVILPFISMTVEADDAVLVDRAVLVELNPVVEEQEETQQEGSEGDGSGTQSTSTPAELAANRSANYISSGGWAVTARNYIDAATMVFDFGANSSVAAASLILPIEQVYTQNGVAPVRIFFFSDNGLIDHNDYSLGFQIPVAEVDVGLSDTLELDVTGPVNAALASGRYVGFRVVSSVPPDQVQDGFPSWTGVKFLSDQYRLSFSPGAAPATDPKSPQFDGFVLEQPNVTVPGIGEADVQLTLFDPNLHLFELTRAEVRETITTPPPSSGLGLLNCSTFSAPEAAPVVTAGAASYSVNSGILDIPSTNMNGEQVALRLEYIEGTDPWIFETLTINEVSSGPSTAIASGLSGGITVEPTQDFVPLCHGWVLLGDSIRNRVVERNLITGETGATYPFNTSPDQFTLDEPNGNVFMTVHPESARLYKLDLATGDISWGHVSQTFDTEFLSFTYRFSVRDVAIGEDGNIFTLLVDNSLDEPGPGIPWTETGLWLGLMDPTANFLTPSIPLEEPIRVEYDQVQDHVFLATESNLATFDFDPTFNEMTFIQGTDIPVGLGCTDLTISPDGQRLAYSCPEGNRSYAETSIVDMTADDYFNADGEWFLDGPPVSATFNNEGTILLASDNKQLYFFDVVTHLLLENFELGLQEEEVIRKIRYSKDGDLIYVYLENPVHGLNSKFYWLKTPAINGTPLQ